MLFAFLVSAFGIAFAVRISAHLIARDLIDRRVMTKIGTVYFATVFAIVFFVPTSRFSLWCAIFLPLAVTAAALCAHVSRRRRVFQGEALGVLSILILKMRSGRSFRQSLIEVTSECDRNVRAKLSEIASVVAFSQQKPSQADAFVQELIEEFRAIDQQPHASLKRLMVLREKIRIEDDFRRRSGQVLARLRAQSLVMCAMYACVFTFMVIKFGWQPNARVLSLSFALFACGVAWMWIGGRRLQWKV